MGSRKFLKSILEFEIMDMNFKHSMEKQSVMNVCIICIQLILGLSGVIISAITNCNMIIFISMVNIIALIMIGVNNISSEMAWNKSKKKQEKIFAMNDLLDDETLNEEDIYYHFSKIKDCNTLPHSDAMFVRLMDKWYKNLYTTKREKLTYKDDKGINYHIGDIVYNPFCGDMWLVEKLSDEDMQKFNFDIPYVLTQYGDINQCVIPINEPEGFIIKSTPNETYSYIRYISLFNKAYKVKKMEELKVKMRGK